MGLVDYICRNPYPPAKFISNYHEEFKEAILSNIQFYDKQLPNEKIISSYSVK